MPETKVVIGGETSPSLDSSVDRAKAKVREIGAETAIVAAEVGKWTAEQVAHHIVMEQAIHRSHSAYEGLSTLIRVGLRGALADVLPVAARAIGAIGLVTGGVKILSMAMSVLDKASGAAQQGLGGFSMIEGLTTRLKPLTGSLEAARLKLGELASDFKGTSITLPDAASAYRSAQLQTGGVLSDKAGLTMLGDVATSSGNGIADTSASVSKLYADLQAGRPIKDAADKLANMGVISGEVRAQIDAMQASGKTGAEVWAMLGGEFAKSSGAMAEARNNLTSLQAAVVQARANLYTAFAESSVPGEKKNLSDRAKIIEQVQPAAQEAGDLYGQIGGSASLATQAANKFYQVILSHAGSLKNWVDVLFTAGIAITAMGAAAVVVGPLLFFGAIAGSAAAGVLGLVAAVGAGAAGLIVWTAHNDRANAAQLALMRGTDNLIEGLKKEGAAITSVTDKALALGKAYDLLKQTRTAIINAKTPAEKDELELRARGIAREITRLETKDEDALAPGAERAKSDVAKKSAEDAHTDATSTFREKLAVAEKTLVDARQKQFEARQALEDPELQKNGPGMVERREAARNTLSQADTAVALAETDAVKQRQGASGKDDHLAELEVERRIAGYTVEGLTRARAEWDIKRGMLATQQATAEAGRDEVKAAEARAAIAQGDAALRERTRAANDQSAGVAVEMQIAALQSDGIARIKQESELRLGLIETRWKEAQAARDLGDVEKQRLAYYQEQQRAQKAVTDATEQQKERAAQYGDTTADRADNLRKRQAELALARKEITPEQKRAVDVDILRGKQKRATEEAAQLDKEAAAERDANHGEQADRLDLEALRKRKDADNFGYDAAMLGTQSTAAQRPVADSLAKLGLGGNVAPPGFNQMATSNEQIARGVTATNVLLQKILDKPTDSRAKFGK